MSDCFYSYLLNMFFALIILHIRIYLKLFIANSSVDTNTRMFFIPVFAIEYDLKAVYTVFMCNDCKVVDQDNLSSPPYGLSVMPRKRSRSRQAFSL